MNLKGGTWIVTTIFSIIIIMLSIFFIPRRVDKVIYDSSIVFDKIIITNFYFDKDINSPNFTDYIITEQENISKIRNLLSKVKVTKLISKPDDGLSNYYKLTFIDTRTGYKIKVYIYNSVYLTTNIGGIKRYKILNEGVGKEIVSFIEYLLENEYSVK